MIRLIAPWIFAFALSAGSVNYTYDSAGRLVLVDYGNGLTIVYSYDAAGNLTSRVVTAPSNNGNQPSKTSQPKPDADSRKSKRVKRNP